MAEQPRPKIRYWPTGHRPPLEQIAGQVVTSSGRTNVKPRSQTAKTAGPKLDEEINKKVI